MFRLSCPTARPASTPIAELYSINHTTKNAQPPLPSTSSLTTAVNPVAAFAPTATRKTQSPRSVSDPNESLLSLGLLQLSESKKNQLEADTGLPLAPSSAEPPDTIAPTGIDTEMGSAGLRAALCFPRATPFAGGWPFGAMSESRRRRSEAAALLAVQA